MENMEQADVSQPRQIYPGIESDPDILHGKPVIQGSRLSVEVVLENLASGDTFDDLMEDYPFLTRDDIIAAVRYAAYLAAQPPTPTSDKASVIL